MDFLNQNFQQLKDLFGSMTPAARITAGLLLVAIVVSLGFLFSYQGSVANEALYMGKTFSEADLAVMANAFSDKGLDSWDARAGRMYVPRGSRAKYLEALAGIQLDGLRDDDHMQKALDGSSVWVPTGLREKRIETAEEQRLADILKQISGIHAARVTVDRARMGGFRQEAKMTALAAVEGIGKRPLPTELIETVRDTVAGAYAMLEPNDVTVLDVGAGMRYNQTHSGTVMNVGNNTYAAHKRYYETEYRAKIQQALGDIPGVRVQVEIHLTKELESRSTSLKLDPQGSVALDTSENEEIRESRRPRPGGEPGLASNGGEASVGQTRPDVETETLERRNNRTQNEPSRELVSTRLAALVPRRGYAIIRLPEEHFLNVWKERHPVADGEEVAAPRPEDLQTLKDEITKEIEDTVVSLLPEPEPGVAPYPQVSVSTYTRLSEPPGEGPSFIQTATVWLTENWQTLGLMGLGLFSLLLLRSTVRSASASSAPAPEIDMPPLVEDEPEEETGTAEAGPPTVLSPNRGGPNLRQELTQLVQSDPEAAISKLRTWLSEVA